MKKFWSLYGIRDAALRSGRAVFSTVELANLVSKRSVVASVYSNRLVRKGLAKKLVSGKISFDVDDFVVASQLLEPCYITGLSALNFLGLVKQVSARIECVSTKRSIRYDKLGIVYHRIPSALFFGFKKQRRSLSYVFVAEPEKAIIDGIYLNVLSEGLIEDLSSVLDKSKLLDYASRFHGRGSKKILGAVKCCRKKN